MVSSNKSESQSNSKGTQLRGQSEQSGVVVQETEPKVRFLFLQGLYTL